MKNGKAKGSRWRKMGFLKNSIVVKTAALLYLFIFIPGCILIWGTYARMRESIFQDFINYKQESILQMSHNMDANFNNLLSQSDALIYRLEDLRPYLTEEQSQLAVIRKAHNVLFDTIFYNDNYDFIMLFSTNGDCVKITSQGNKTSYSPYEENYRNTGWFQGAMENNGYPYMEVVDYLGEEPYSIVVSRTLNDYDHADIPIGVSVFGQDISKFVEIATAGTEFDQQLFYLYSPDREILYSENSSDEQTAHVQELIKQGTPLNSTEPIALGDGQYYMAGTEDSDFGYGIFLLMDSELFESRLYPMQVFFIVLTVVMLVLSPLLAILFAYHLSKPVKEVVSGLKRIEQGKLDTTITVKGNDELSQIKRAINNMAANLNRLMDERIELTARIKEVEIRALISKMNPHFLYNTMATLVALIDSGDKKGSIKLVQDLSDYYRYSLDRGNSIIDFAQELENTKKYIAIQMLQYKGRVTVEYDVDEDTLSCSIFKMTLQPVVENAFVHGVREKDAQCKIQISSRAMQDKFIIYVFDDGKGIDARDVQRINGMLQGVTPDDSGLVGIFNVNDRIKLKFGEEYGLFLSSEEGSGTMVKIVLPFSRGD